MKTLVASAEPPRPPQRITWSITVPAQSHQNVTVRWRGVAEQSAYLTSRTE